VGSIAFTVMPLSAAIDLVIATSAAVPAGDAGHPGLAIHFCNAYNVALARKDAGYARLLAAADVVFSDGVPITWVGRRAYPTEGTAWERVYGPDVMRGVLDRSTADGPTHYLLGSTPETLDALRAQIAVDHPQAIVVGAESPPFRTATPDELAARDQRIRDSGASIVWVGLGTPKQDTEVQRLAGSLPVLAMAVGAAFDFLAGTKPQAPEWMQRSGLEWAFRLASEPGRLGKRYVWGNSVFALEAARTMWATRTQRR
jgi:N-acetylglucosaminyldiphosphoundecaprenol N-acetyl-beta-D-mannosaminyltransferase